MAMPPRSHSLAARATVAGDVVAGTPALNTSSTERPSGHPPPLSFHQHRNIAWIGWLVPAPVAVATSANFTG
jgi:hypothetical protein